MNIQFKNTVTAEEYNKLRKEVGWHPLENHQAERGLNNSYYIIAASIKNCIIGFVRVISDGGYMALIVDVMVSPKYQGKGIGSILMKNAMNYIKTNLADGLTVMINIMAVQGKENFYKKFGFIERPNNMDGAGMHLWLNPFN
ncbi:MAG: GNAT family N-acetyltransferase [Eubacteriales bacterium]|nr:GNAT family N-acetyltransferase [Eubacteriales bacterium]MDD3200358.1 GNAT family N-acetyltransferase [Eubacteriales bacterium]MDD4121869.1 GNAT family N-acetyltransferase [Eubacteriales bacterium]MDD4630550.1 GNAT family N-acetyltransferase [Eubacteriales bacterium]